MLNKSSHHTLSQASVYQASPPQSRVIKMRYAPGGVPTQIVASHLLLRGPLDVDRLRDAVVMLVCRHPILRTNYALLDTGEVLAIVHDKVGPGVFTTTEPSGLSDERDIRDHVARVFEVLTRNFHAPDRHPMLQALLVPHGKDLHSLLIAIDHVAVDERARAVLQRELALIYAGRQDDLGEVRPYDPTAVRSTFPGIDDTPALRELLEPLPPRLLPEPDLEGDPGAFRPLMASRVLDPVTTGLLGNAQQALRCTRFVIHVAAVMWMLKEFIQSDDVAIATVIDTRLRTDDFHTVGYFQNLALLRSRSPRSAGLDETLAECKALTRDAFKRRDYPIASLISYAAARREGRLCRNPLYQVALIYAVDNGDQGWSLDGIDVSPIELARSQAANELRLHLTDHPSQTEMVLVGAAGSLGRSDLDRLLSLWHDAVESLVLGRTRDSTN